jgi:hypothetical protein
VHPIHLRAAAIGLGDAGEGYRSSGAGADGVDGERPRR